MTDPLFDISGRRILIAGAAGGIGRVFARALAERGARLVLADLDGVAEDFVTALPGEGHSACRLDVRDDASCQAAVELAVRDGGLDVSINCTGIFRTAPALELSAQGFEETLATNLLGAFLISRQSAKAMVLNGGGRIINLASVSSSAVNPDYAAYAASKAGLAQLTRVLALEWAASNVTVNAIGPAMIHTPLVESYLRQTGTYEYQMSRIPMGRFLAVEDLIGVCVLLASEAGAFITGQTIYVDGGRTLV